MRLCISKLLKSEFLVELFNTAAGIDKLLLAGIEGVTFRANLNRYVLLCGACFYNLAAGASDGGLLVVGMDTFLHYVHLFHEYQFQNAICIVAQGL